MKNLVIFLVAILTMIIFSVACDKDKRGTCPLCDENITSKGYGKLKFLNTGYDGDLSSDWSSLHIESDCNWKIYMGNVGGVGNTYEVYSSSCDTSVVLVWMWGNFSAIIANKNWKGYFNNPADNIKMGCDMNQFLKKYPNYKPWCGVTECLTTVFFTDSKSLHYLFVDDVSEHISYVGFSLDKKWDWLYLTGYN